MDLTQLLPQQFELLCTRLLSAAGYEIMQREPRSRDAGADFLVKDDDGKSIVVEVKHYRRRITSTQIVDRAAAQISAVRDFLPADAAILIVSMRLPERIRFRVEEQRRVSIHDARWVDGLLASHPEIESEFALLIDTQTSIAQRIPETVAIDPRAEELIQLLESLEPGKAFWRQYEDLCLEILNYLFIPPFRVPKVQSRSEDGLDIRDAVYPIGNGHHFWDGVKSDCRTRFTVAEFKNHTSGPSQKEVESLQQYLFKKAMRMFGLLCARLPPTDSALKARRRSWLEFDKLIVILSDDELIDMLRIRGSDSDPTDVIDAQLDEFFLELAP
jgi:Holliday junction resolvase-like predicted endonuclease